MKKDFEYYLLTLSHHGVKLYKGDQYGLVPVNLKGLSTSMEASLRLDEYPKWRETHTIAAASTGKGSEAYHGQYNVSQTDKVMLREFFRRIDRRLRRFMQRRREPLLLAGVNYLLPIYRRVNSYPRLLPEALTGNMDRASLQQLHQQAWALITSAKRKPLSRK